METDKPELLGGERAVCQQPLATSHRSSAGQQLGQRLGSRPHWHEGDSGMAQPQRKLPDQTACHLALDEEGSSIPWKSHLGTTVNELTTLHK